MIGGTDIVIPASGGPTALDACARIVQHHWPQARFEDAISGEKFRSYCDIPIGRVQELIAYRNPQAEAGWDADSPDSPPNSMLYLILSPHHVTAVVDDPGAADIRSMLESIRAAQMDILSTYAGAA